MCDVTRKWVGGFHERSENGAVNGCKLWAWLPHLGLAKPPRPSASSSSISTRRVSCSTRWGRSRARSLPPHRIVVIDNASTDESADGDHGDVSGCDAAPAGREHRLRRRQQHRDRDARRLRARRAAEPRCNRRPGVARQRSSQPPSEHPEMAAFASMIERAGDAGLLDSAGDVYHVYGTAWPGRHGRSRRERRLAEEEVFGPSGAAALYRRDVARPARRLRRELLLLLRGRRPQPAPPGRRRPLPLRACGPRPARRRREQRRPVGVHDLPLAAQPRLDVRQVGAAAHLLALPADARPSQRRARSSRTASAGTRRRCCGRSGTRCAGFPRWCARAGR